MSLGVGFVLRSRASFSLCVGKSPRRRWGILGGDDYAGGESAELPSCRFPFLCSSGAGGSLRRGGRQGGDADFYTEMRQACVDDL